MCNKIAQVAADADVRPLYWQSLLITLNLCHACFKMALTQVYDLNFMMCDVGRPLLLLAGRGQTLSTSTPDLLKNLAQNRQVTMFDNRDIGL